MRCVYNITIRRHTGSLEFSFKITVLFVEQAVQNKKCTFSFECVTLYIALLGSNTFKGEIDIMKLGIVV